MIFVKGCGLAGDVEYLPSESKPGFLLMSDRCLKRSEVLTTTYDFEPVRGSRIIVAGLKFLCVPSSLNRCLIG